MPSTGHLQNNRKDTINHGFFPGKEVKETPLVQKYMLPFSSSFGQLGHIGCTVTVRVRQVQRHLHYDGG